MRAKEGWGAVAIALCHAGALGAADASAASCEENWVRAPAPGASGVPTNTRLWGWGYHPQTSWHTAVRLIGPAGEVPLEVSFVPVFVARQVGQYLPVYTPTTELEPDEIYWIEEEGSPYANRPTTFSRFVTAFGPAEKAPALPELLSSEGTLLESAEGIDRYRELAFAEHTILIGDIDGRLSTFDSIDEITQDEIDPDVFEAPPGAPLLSWITANPTLSVGLADCLLWPSASDRVEGRFGTFDLSGNFSGWLEVPLELPELSPEQRIAEEERLQQEAEREAHLRAISEGGQHGQGHLTGCALAAHGAPASARRALSGPALLLALGIAMTLRRRRIYS